jgi:tripeptide aminopeptidase
VDTPSSEEGDKVPSTPEQLNLARMLEEELKTMGLEAAHIDRSGFVTATLRANGAGSAPVVGFLAHMDTVPGIPGHGVKPLVHHYSGGDIHLPCGNGLSAAEHPLLKHCVGHTIVTSSGDTLLGADDKAGIADIMEAICRLINHPEIKHGDIKVAFTPDEETGKGIEHFDTASFGASAAYTLDGGPVGELEDENFNAANVGITITGRSAHTGTARGQMVNAVHVAAELINSIPANMRPETTDGRLGFIHAGAIEGDVEEARMHFLLRDFDETGLKAKADILHNLIEGLKLRYPEITAKYEEYGGYRNMKPILDKQPRVTAYAQQAIKQAELEPVMALVRGGTDGARLTYMGLPTPNIFTGSANHHSRTEWASLEWMEKAVEVVVNLVKIWAEA